MNLLPVNYQTMSVAQNAKQQDSRVSFKAKTPELKVAKEVKGKAVTVAKEITMKTEKAASEQLGQYNPELSMEQNIAMYFNNLFYKKS